MKLPYESQLLRVFIDETDHYHGKPLYHAIVETAREMGMAGATVLHGIMGFGSHSRMHTANILRLSEGLPVVIEIVDKPERIDAFLPVLDVMVNGGLVTLEYIKVIAYRHGESNTQTGQTGT